MNSCITGCLINTKSRLESVHLLKSFSIPHVIVQAQKAQCQFTRPKIRQRLVVDACKNKEMKLAKKMISILNHEYNKFYKMSHLLKINLYLQEYIKNQ